jgi:hypothetical protein
VAEHVPQGHLGQLTRADAEVGGQRVGALFDLRLPVAAEVPVAEVPGGENGLGRDPAGEAALVQRDPDDDADAVLGAGGQQLLLRLLGGTRCK